MAVNSNPRGTPARHAKDQEFVSKTRTNKMTLNLLGVRRRNWLAGGLLDSRGCGSRLALADVAVGGRDGVVRLLLLPCRLLGPLRILPC